MTQSDSKRTFMELKVEARIEENGKGFTRTKRSEVSVSYWGGGPSFVRGGPTTEENVVEWESAVGTPTV